MAYAALLSLSRVLREDLPLYHDFITPDSEQIHTLHSNVVFLQEFLEGFSGNHSSSSIVKPLESRITDVAYHLEDIIACDISDRSFDISDRPTCIKDVHHGARTFSLQRIFSKIGCCYKEINSSVEDEVDPVIEEHAQERYLRGMFSTFGSCIEQVSSIVEEAMNIKQTLDDQQNNQVASSTCVSWITSPVSISGSGKDSKVVGLDSDLIQIKERVIGNNTALQIIPIVGMGGIGKTTLARIVYEDQLIIERFKNRIWVTVSKEYDAKKILLRILHDDKEEQSDEDVESLIVRVYQHLKSKRFILILDDLWDATVWDCVRRAIPDDNNGSRIILTTRLIDVAAKVDSSSSLHKMQPRDDDQSWALFQKQVYCPPQLEDIGRMITQQCKGIPLVLILIAGLLKLNHSQDYWEKLPDNINEATAATYGDDQLLGVLFLSYENLPPHLKACFLYMSMFPEDQYISTKKLIFLWISEGFVKQESDKSMEELAWQYLEDLVQRNLIFVAERSSSTGEMRTCTIHDVLRDFSIRKAQEEKFFLHYMRRYADKTNLTIMYQRRVSVTGSVLQSLQSHTSYKPVRTLLLHHFSQQLPIENFELLRVLDAYRKRFSAYDVKMFSLRLIHLRYLSLSYIVVTEGLQLAEITKNLRNLETLILSLSYDPMNKAGPTTIVFHILTLPKLRHFSVLQGATQKKYLSVKIGEHGLPLSSMRTLSGLVNNEFRAGSVKILKNLIKLKITYYEDEIRQLGRFGLKNLVYLDQLENLNMTVQRNLGSLFKPSLEDLTFPCSLIKLTLASVNISSEQMSVIGSLPRLEVLKLIGCWFKRTDQWALVEGQFHKLKYLKLRVNNLKVWKVESTHFLCLEQLHVHSCSNLNELPCEVGDMNLLKKLSVVNCYKRVVDSARKIQEEQLAYGNDELEVEVVTGWRGSHILEEYYD